MWIGRRTCIHAFGFAVSSGPMTRSDDRLITLHIGYPVALCFLEQTARRSELPVVQPGPYRGVRQPAGHVARLARHHEHPFDGSDIALLREGGGERGERGRAEFAVSPGA